jgi:hypothetical protein
VHSAPLPLPFFGAGGGGGRDGGELVVLVDPELDPPLLLLEVAGGELVVLAGGALGAAVFFSTTRSSLSSSYSHVLPNARCAPRTPPCLKNVIFGAMAVTNESVASLSGRPAARSGGSSLSASHGRYITLPLAAIEPSI